MVAASTYLWSTMTPAQGLGFGPADVVSFDTGGGAGQDCASGETTMQLPWC